MTYQVAIVDDNESVRTAILRFVHSSGMTAIGFPSAESFLASDYLGEIGCLLLDVQMPGMTGPQLQRVVRARGHRVPILFMTAAEDPDLRDALLAAGALAVLRKPTIVGELVAALRLALEAHESGLRPSQTHDLP